MCLIRFGRQGREKPGVLLDEKRTDLSAYFQDWNSTFFAESGLEKLSALPKADEASRLPEVREGDRWGLSRTGSPRWKAFNPHPCESKETARV